MILFGGSKGTFVGLADTWAFDGEVWTRLEPPVCPPPRYDHAMAYDAARDRIVLDGR